MRTLAVVMLLMLVSRSIADDSVSAYWESKRKEAITALEQQIKDLSLETTQIGTGKKPPPPGVSRIQATKQGQLQVAELKLQLKKMNDPRHTFPPSISPHHWKIGDEGPIDTGGRFNGIKFSQVIDEQNVICALVTPRDTEMLRFWIRGYSTKGIADGKRVDNIPGVWKVVDTKTYQTATGSATVMLIEPWQAPKP